MRGSRPFRQADTSRCGFYGRSAHRKGELDVRQLESNATAVAIATTFLCVEVEGVSGSGGDAGGSSHKGGIPGSKSADHSSRSRVHMKRNVVGTVRARQRHRPAPTISLQFRDLAGKSLGTVDNNIPDGGAEATVVGMDVLPLGEGSRVIYLQSGHGR
jgi:hypothetical protein